MDVEVSLRIPNMKVRSLDENGYPLDHSSVRFKKMMTVPASTTATYPVLASTKERISSGDDGASPRTADLVVVGFMLLF